MRRSISESLPESLGVCRQAGGREQDLSGKGEERVLGWLGPSGAQPDNRSQVRSATSVRQSSPRATHGAVRTGRISDLRGWGVGMD
jgi:hypothetical protein